MPLGALWKLGATAPNCETEDVCELLRTILPIFDVIVERARHGLSDGSEVEIFYLDFNVRVIGLLAVLVKWDPAGTVQRLPAEELKLKTNLMRVLDELENVFVSQKGQDAEPAYKRLGFDRRQTETYPKLRALKRVLPHDDEVDEQFFSDVNCIIRVYRKSPEKRTRMLNNLQQALDFLYSTQPFAFEADPTCPIRFSDYPLKHVRKLATTLFDVVQKNWSCQCRSTSLVSRNTRLNLTQYQRFETFHHSEQVFINRDTRFRVLFPTTSSAADWQDTEITVTERNRVADQHEKPKYGLCGIIHGPLMPRDLNQPHRFPDILSLGVLLLEIARGAVMDVEESQDRCVVALEYMDKWVTVCRRDSSKMIPDGLYRAISACVDPKESRTNYIFERVVYPLEDALSTTYEVQPNALHSSISQGDEANCNGSFDHQDEDQLVKIQAATEWVEHWERVNNLFQTCHDLCGREDRTASRVKVAVLDTGLQLPKILQETYEEEGRINVQQSATFISPTGSEAIHEWNVDQDGHGSRVGGIILRFAPTVDLHVAKVFQTRDDLADPNIATQVHGRIAQAIFCATNDWNVDMIIMSFGFDRPIRLIREAIDEASRAVKPPLFFAATRNDGAHKPMAWPARDMAVIGVSSTAGDGSVSTFNPSDSQTNTVLYAFGEGVPVKVAHPNTSVGFSTKYVSGTSYATPVASALVGNLLGCIRMMVQTSSSEDQENYILIPKDLQRMGDLLTVLRRHMQQKSVSGVESLLPWHFLNDKGLENNRILKDVAATLRDG
ncbi:subtilisin-like protease [Fusarium flagelliforme]|uniref:Subtilisin-like protease n=1 Tax=Fusarium flagelliforme TaxID=2675880 RepID=A0A395MUB8_9HYPO|nr:subtilisin-like protease [Fusarium flagelliforme]